MRALRVIGTDGATLVLSDPQTDQRFTLANDERLRAAMRADREPSQPVLEGEPSMRPKEIQARIRAGASVEEVAALAGASAARIATFAHPVLLERATIAEKAQQARPSVDGITSSTPVSAAVRAALAGRGHDGALTWDAFKQDGAWVLALTWQVGRSTNQALWTYHPGADGGTLTARNDTASEVVDPALKVLRPLREVRQPHRQDVITDTLLDPTVPTVSTPAPAAPAPAAEAKAANETEQAELVEQTVTDDRSAALPARAEVARTGTDSRSAAPARPAKRGSRPAMPSWEDVLIGTRSPRR